MILEKQASMIAAALRRMSLKTRLTVATVGLFVLFIWVLVFLSVTVLQDRLEKVLSAQQLASTRHSAIEIDNSLLDRLEGLRRVAALLPADLRDEVQQPALSNRPLLGIYFPGGSLLLGLDGKVIAEHPPGGVRRERDFKDEDYFRQVVATRQPYIGKPGVDPVSRRPTLTLAVPALDEEGRVRAVLTGAVNLTAPNFSSLASEQAQEGKGAFFVLSLRDRRVVVAGDSGRVATALPARGRDAMLDRMADGFEGSGIGVGADGVSRLYSGKRVQMADWLVLSVLPTEVAFAPVRVMRNALYVVGALLTFLALGLLHGLTRRMLAPLDEAGDAMRRMTDGRTPLAPLPLRRNDEIGQLIGNFNHLVEDRSRYETALRESEQRFRLLVEAAPDAIIVQTAGHIVYANTAAISLLGARGEEQLLGMPVLAHVHPDCHEMVSRRIRALDSGSIYVPPLEQTYLRLDGTPVAVEVSAVRFRYEAQDGALVYVRDITERKALERERESQALRLVGLSRRLLAVQEEERRRLSAELHDRTSPNLSALSIMLRTAEQQGPLAGAEERAALLEDARALLDDTTASIREISAELRPPVLDYGGLLPALESHAESFAARTGIAVRVDCPAPVGRLSPEIESSLFRIAQEAMTNCAKHAGAAHIDIALRIEDDQLVLVIADDGVGFEREQLVRPGHGLLIMRERAEFAGGHCEIDSRPGAATRVTVSIPVGTRGTRAWGSSDEEVSI